MKSSPVDATPLGAAWWIKVICGSFLLVHTPAVLLGAWSGGPRAALPLIIGQAVAIAAGIVYVSAALALRRGSGGMARPAHLVTRDGPYCVIRHPMYLGDILWTGGLALLAADITAAALWIAGAFAAARQARREDRHLAQRFPEAHAAWRARTGLLLPRFR